MENSKNLAMIDKFIDNERKSRIWTTVNIGIFCLLGLSVFWLAYELNKSNAKFKTQNVELKKTKDELASALQRLSAYNASLQEDSFSLSNRVGNYDSLKKVLDTVLLLFKQSQSQSYSAAPMDDKINQYSQQVFNHDVKISENLKNIIAAPEQNTVNVKAYKVYVQFMPGYEKMSARISYELKQNRYAVPVQEQVDAVTFDPVVKYFHDEDKQEAEKVAAIVNRSDPYFDKNPITLQRMKLKSPMRQLEIWVGEYRQKDVQQILQQPIRNINTKKGL
jgi:hypothetical protein